MTYVSDMSSRLSGMDWGMVASTGKRVPGRAKELGRAVHGVSEDRQLVVGSVSPLTGSYITPPHYLPRRLS